MIRDIFDKIKLGEEVRQNLIQLKADLKEKHNKTALLYYIGNDVTIFNELLQNEDAKIRKNTSLIMGQLALPEFLDSLYEAYKCETQLYIKSAYLTAIKEFDYSKYLSEFKDILNELSAMTLDDSNKKHIHEEMRALSDLIISSEGMKKHLFTGYEMPAHIVLLTNRNYVNATLEQLRGIKAKEFNAGVLAETNQLRDVLEIRTYSELLFRLMDINTCKFEATGAAEAIANSSLMQFMKKRHKGEAPFYFRIELKSKIDLAKKSAFTKKMGMELEHLTGRQFVNSTSNYEFEIRLIENKEGSLNVLIKLYTIKDNRFSYRIQSIATSIQPVNAALITTLVKDYLIEGAQVLDPFCGVGTMLIERNKLMKASTSYGLDIYGEAIDKGKENADAANCKINFINRDFFDFKHEYLFDEIITNMPRVMGHKEEEEIYQLYRRFFQKAKEHLKKSGIMIIYSHNKEYIKKLINPMDYRIEKEYEISKKEGAYLYIVRYV